MNIVILATRTVLSKYVTFSGRASRPEFWWWFLSLVVALGITGVIDGAVIAPLLGFDTFQEEAGQPLTALLGLAVVLPNIALGVRRLHDAGRVGWWLFIGLIPVLGTLVLVYFYIQPSEEGDNQYGAAQSLSRS